MPKEEKTLSNHSISLRQQLNKRTHRHKLAPFAEVDVVPITMHPSPITKMTLTSTDHRDQISRMEIKLGKALMDGNSPCAGQQNKLLPLGEIHEDLFDAYLMSSMPSHLFTRSEEHSPAIDRQGDKVYDRHIVYNFQYPHFPSFQSQDWASNYVKKDQSVVANSLRSLGANLPANFHIAYFRCMAKKLIITMNATTQVYSFKLVHWVQKKNSRSGKWLDSF